MRISRSTRTLFAGAAMLVVLAAGCSQKYGAERDGKKIGEAICDLRNATTADAANAAKNDIAKQLDDLGNKYAVYTAEDRKDLNNNLADLAEHSVQGNTVLRQQDLAVIQRSARNLAEDSGQTRRAAWEGVQEGLDSCME